MRRVPSGVVVVLLLVLAGCAGFGAPADPARTPGSTAAGVPTAGPLPDATTTVSVTAVVDGDTVRVEYANGTRDTVRLVGVDTPEVTAENDPSEFEGVPDTEAGAGCLHGAGVDASTHAKERLLGETVGLAFDPDTDRRGYYDRLLAYLVVDDRLFNYRLVATGHARVYDESPFSRRDRFLAAESAAREARRGLWRCVDPDLVTQTTPMDTASESGLAVTEIHADAEGDDNENLNDEYVVLANRGDAPLTLTGWTVADEAGHVYTFRNYTLGPGETVTLHTGRGTDTRTDRYWGRTGAVWNNGGDTVVVRDADGRLVLEREY
ncbi:lamin tail domain-containing protein [Halomicroarcula sp. F13]|uniref:Lamin tail domain-containing protein n=1 Tax=Haloarcula rubra TaxID=2487747 RepID=A0AAW4PS98_9EURY|nr:lamin tail domain-containing protein [Halomicroarcula rubra]MBX0324115.1 lamin tail domain-containing protein [Halomicroarcula rubra]